ncbi:MAG: redoxin domain-containing protein [Rhodocyclales bacterium]|nr:redoxin domain-containing protein [Rhodocyclales bacterium]
MKRFLLLAGALLFAAWAGAAELRPFVPGDMARLLQERQGRPFVLTLWSLDCPHCKGTLRQLAALAKARPAVDLVVVSTDSLGDSQHVAALLAATGLAQRDTWVFGDAAPERLRFEIDRRWGGEMPRTYLFDRDHKSAAFSGAVAEAELQQWLARNFGAGRGLKP